MLYGASKIITLHQGVINDGCVRVVDKRIVDVGAWRLLKDKYPNDHELFFENTALLPGLINAHTHLEYGPLRDVIDYSSSFSIWLSDFLHKRQEISFDEEINAVHLGVLECLNSGTTTVLDSSYSGASFKILFNERLRSIIFLEFSLAGGKDPATIFADTLAKASGFLANELSNWGICPHAPYSVPEELFRQCLAYAAEQNVFVLSHVAESKEEHDLFLYGTGGLNAALSRHGMGLSCPIGESPVSYLFSRSLVPRKMIVAHANFVSDQEIARMARQEVSVVICPRSWQRFNHGPFPLEKFRASGINVCVGTDSLATVDSLNLFDELFCLKSLAPALSGEEILCLAIQGGARAIGLNGVLGQVRQGFLADLIGVRLHECSSGDVVEEILTEDRDVVFVLVNGKEVLV